MPLRKKYKALINELKSSFAMDNSGHDWHHIQRVVDIALKLASKEGGNEEIIFLAALLHDVGDHKFYNGDHSVAPKMQKQLLLEHCNDNVLISKVISISSNISFSKNTNDRLSLEGQIVQDADRLDAMGYIGIARCFAYGGNKNRPIFSTENNENSLQHFDDKLLKLYNLLNTESAKYIGKMRHEILQNFKEGFLNEWNTVLNYE